MVSAPNRTGFTRKCALLLAYRPTLSSHHCRFPTSQSAQVLVSGGGIWCKVTFCIPGFLSNAMLSCLPWVFSLQKGLYTLWKTEEYPEIGSRGQVVLLLSGFPKSTVLDIKEYCEHNYVFHQPKFECFSVTCKRNKPVGFVLTFKNNN